MSLENNQSNSAAALLALGEDVLESLKQSRPDALDRLESYTRAFDAWEASWKTPGGSLPCFDIEIGKRIERQHALVVQLTEGMLQSVEQSLRELRGWSRGIRAYMDHLPKQVSTMRTKKG